MRRTPQTAHRTPYAACASPSPHTASATHRAAMRAADDAARSRQVRGRGRCRPRPYCVCPASGRNLSDVRTRSVRMADISCLTAGSGRAPASTTRATWSTTCPALDPHASRLSAVRTVSSDARTAGAGRSRPDLDDSSAAPGERVKDVPGQRVKDVRGRKCQGCPCLNRLFMTSHDLPCRWTAGPCHASSGGQPITAPPTLEATRLGAVMTGPPIPRSVPAAQPPADVGRSRAIA